MLISAVLAAVGVAAVIAVRTAQAQETSPVRVGSRIPERPAHRSGTLGWGDDSWDSTGHGSRNC